MRILQDMPDAVSFEELMDRIVYLFKVEQGLQQSAQGKGKSIQEIRNELHKWRQAAE